VGYEATHHIRATAAGKLRWRHQHSKEVASQTWRWSLSIDEAGVLDRVRSVSYVAAMPEDRQRRVDERVLFILREHGLNSSESPIEFGYLTEAYVLRRRSAVRS